MTRFSSATRIFIASQMHQRAAPIGLSILFSPKLRIGVAGPQHYSNLIAGECPALGRHHGAVGRDGLRQLIGSQQKIDHSLGQQT